MPTTAEIGSAEARVESLINARRDSRGKQPFRVDPRVAGTRACQVAGHDDRDYFDHADRKGHFASYHLSRAGVRFTRVGEIIAWGRFDGDLLASADEAVDLWMHSAPHKKLILSGNNYFGAGVATDGRSWKWTVIFITGRDRTDPRASITTARADGGEVTVRWTGSDPRLVTGTAGLRGFDLERRTPGGEWKRMRNATRNRTYVREHSPGVTFEFRVRARDKAGNIGDWTEPVAVTVQ
ncbi:MAG: hypothetical protein U0667_00750 [Chloroflexota bacterium]